MARRNPQNPRYQRDAQVGSTRKSASSAKPKRAAGSPGSDKKKSTASASKTRVPLEPTTPEFKRWRKIWLGLLVAAVVFSIGAWWQQATAAGTISLVFAYSCLFTALFIDLTRIRRMRKEWRAQHSAGGVDSGGKKKAAAKEDESDDSNGPGEKG